MITRRELLVTTWATTSAVGLPVCAQGTSTRVALVIGNAAYPNAALPNAANDAKAMAAALGSLGFRVVEARDASRDQMDAAITQARQLLQGQAGVGLLYYAGHGLQLDWHNYLVPVDAQLVRVTDVPRQTVNVQRVIDAFRDAGTVMNILVLDACRDNPFGPAVASQGLAPLDAPPGTYFAYATSPGNVAEDGSAADGNGLYTRFLLKEMVQPGAKIEEVFKRVRLQVRKASQGRQIPWESSSLLDEFVFASGERLATPALPSFERAYAQEQAAWLRIADSRHVADFYNHVQRYPGGVFAELCEARIEKLERARIVSQPARDQAPDATGAARPPRVGDEFDVVDKDGRIGSVNQRFTTRVTKVTDEFFEYETLDFSGRPTLNRLTLQYALMQDAQGSYDPPWVLVPAGEIRIGHRWRGRTRRTRGGQWDWLDYESQVAARETITVAGERHDTYRLESRLSFGDGLLRRVTRWFDPSKVLFVRAIVESIRQGPGGLDREVRLLEVVTIRKAPAN